MSENKIYGDTDWFAPDADTSPQAQMDAVSANAQAFNISAGGISVSLIGGFMAASCRYDLVAGISFTRAAFKDTLRQDRKDVSMARKANCSIENDIILSIKNSDMILKAAEEVLNKSCGLNLNITK